MDLGIEGLGDATWIGSGASAIVYEARQERLDRAVAVKVLTEKDPSFIRRFDREARMLGQLSQKSGIVTVYDTGVTSSGEPYLILELCPSSLQDRLNREVRIDPVQACRILAHISKAVSGAHDLGVIHRDLKPANILVSPDGEPLVTDFGIGTIIGDNKSHTTTSVGFTPGYVAPETLNGERPQAPADVYAIGATLYHLVNGKAPFVDTLEDAGNLLALASIVMTSPVPDLRLKGIPGPVCDVIEAAMAKDPDDRPNAMDLSRALQAIADGRAPENLGTAGNPADRGPHFTYDQPSGNAANNPGTPQSGRSVPSAQLPPPSTQAPGAVPPPRLPDPGPGAPVRPAPPAPGPSPVQAAPGHRSPAPQFQPPQAPGTPQQFAQAPGQPAAPNQLHRPAGPPPGLSGPAQVGGGSAQRSSRSPLIIVLAVFGVIVILGLIGLAGSSREGEPQVDPIEEVPTSVGDAEREFVDTTAEAGDRTDEEASDAGATDQATPDNDTAAGGVATTVQPAEFVSEASPTCSGATDNVLRFGGLLPETGDLAFLGKPMAAGVELAVAEINAAGGVRGQEVEWVPGDSAASPEVADATVDRLLGSEVDVVIGAATSRVSSSVIAKIGDACVVQISPSNTSTDLTANDPAQMYFRTTPSDLVQAQALADVIVDDGAATVHILGINNDYGQDIVLGVERALKAYGVPTADFSLYTGDAEASGFQAEVDATVAANPDAVVIVGFEETPDLLKALFAAGIDNGTTRFYLVDGNLTDYSAAFSEPGVLVGTQGVNPLSEPSAEFQDRLQQQDPSLAGEYAYGAEAYDAVIIAALASQAAGSDDPAQVARHINGTTAVGQRCTSFVACSDLLSSGVDIDYDGQSGPLTFNQTGEPNQANFGVLTYGDDNTIDRSKTTYRLVTAGS